MRVPTSLRVTAIAATLVLSVAACGGGESDQTDTATGTDVGAETEAAADIPQLEDGVLAVCTDSPYPPFEFEEDGEMTGFDVELVRAISEDLGVAAEFQVTPFEGIQSGAALAADQCDIAASAMTITEDREENVDFSEPYFDATQSLLVRTEDVDQFSTLEDLAGERIGVQADTTGAAYAEENAPEGAEIVEYPDAPTAFTALKAGEIEAILQDFPVNAYTATQEEGFEVVEEYDTNEQYGFAVKEEGAEELLEAINAALAELRETGEYDEIFATWFGDEAAGGGGEMSDDAAGEEEPTAEETSS